MNTTKNCLPIGVFDSGVGGVSVLAEALKSLPSETYIYYADSANAPYGTKDVEKVRSFSIRAANFLVDLGIKALVVACNTATSVAVNYLREMLDMPVIGMEPAVKPAVELKKEGDILVMATPVTLKEKKFAALLERYRDKASIKPLPCPGLAELIENGHTQGTEIMTYLDGLFNPFDLSQVSAIVLGCTHYVFVKQAVSKAAGENIFILDGNRGTVQQLKNTLKKEGLLIPESTRMHSSPPPCAETFSSLTEQVSFYTSGQEEKVIPLCKDLLVNALEKKQT